MFKTARWGGKFFHHWTDREFKKQNECSVLKDYERLKNQICDLFVHHEKSDGSD
ncbi:hypothetical protein LEP1GSC150_5318 [Leptospira interrogans serovar Copenhageni str. LT2050]|uniref:Uncharacterized protein n=1 Tax=Leptospira interrogans serovar Copenhageni str. LT2050 TaxID=1001598 RepID=M3HW75_LEPIT|nr:hypothetical protein LEP1GSC150_5318 [Leptospira interrogans serovar Copenhageni str. LT2050]